jgi:hypothetical protein
MPNVDMLLMKLRIKQPLSIIYCNVELEAARNTNWLALSKFCLQHAPGLLLEYFFSNSMPIVGERLIMGRC